MQDRHKVRSVEGDHDQGGAMNSEQKDRWLRATIGLCGGIIIVAALYFSAPVFAPLTFALMVIAIVWPVQRRLQAILPQVVALLVTIAGTAFIVTELSSLVAWSFGRVARHVISDAANFQRIYGQIAGWLEGHGVAVAGLWAEHFNVGWVVRVFQVITTKMNSALSFSLVMLTYAILGLLEVNSVVSRLRAQSAARFGPIVLAAGAETAAKLRRYMLVRTIMSLATGLLVWAFAKAIGLELALEWGVIAFVLNYVPFLGPLIATVLPTLVAVTQYGSWEMVVLVFVCLNLIQFVLGSYIEPRMAGRSLAMSPFLVLFSVFFWTFLWGIAGALIGLPIMIALLTFLEQQPSTRWIAELMGESAGSQDVSASMPSRGAA
jgi:AI-2 transport protein TqsA